MGKRKRRMCKKSLGPCRAVRPQGDIVHPNCKIRRFLRIILDSVCRDLLLVFIGVTRAPTLRVDHVGRGLIPADVNGLSGFLGVGCDGRRNRRCQDDAKEEGRRLLKQSGRIHLQIPQYIYYGQMFRMLSWHFPFPFLSALQRPCIDELMLISFTLFSARPVFSCPSSPIYLNFVWFQAFGASLEARSSFFFLSTLS